MLQVVSNMCQLHRGATPVTLKTSAIHQTLRAKNPSLLANAEKSGFFSKLVFTVFFNTLQ